MGRNAGDPDLYLMLVNGGKVVNFGFSPALRLGRSDAKNWYAVILPRTENFVIETEVIVPIIQPEHIIDVQVKGVLLLITQRGEPDPQEIFEKLDPVTFRNWVVGEEEDVRFEWWTRDCFTEACLARDLIMTAAERLIKDKGYNEIHFINDFCAAWAGNDFPWMLHGYRLTGIQLESTQISVKGRLTRES